MIDSNKVWKKNYDNSFTLTTLKVNDLSKGSGLLSRVKCDYCLKLNESSPEVMYKQYNNYNNSRKYVDLDCCRKHQGLKNKDIARKKYGVDNYMQVPEINKKVADQRRTSIEKIREEFEKRGLVLVSIRYKSNADNLVFYCKKHPNKGLQDVTYANFTHGNGKGSGCDWCGREKSVLAHIGEKSHFWKGGKNTTSIIFENEIK